MESTKSILVAESWQNQYARALQKEQEHCVSQFQWINQYEALYQTHTHLRKENHELKQQLSAARDEVQQLRTSSTNGSNFSVSSSFSSSPSAPFSSSSSASSLNTISGNTNATTANIAATAEITRLQSKLLELQDQLTSFYRKESETVKERLTLSESNQRLKETVTTLQSDLTHTKETCQQLQEMYDQSKSALAVREGQLSVTTDELTRVRTMLDSKAKESDILNTQMEGIASRIATEKERSATEINNLNSTVANLRRDRAQLELLVENLYAKIKEKDTEIDSLKLAIQMNTNSSTNNTNSLSKLPNMVTTGSVSNADGGLINRANPLLAGNVPAPLQELTNRASSLFGQVSAFVSANTGGSNKSVILPATSSSSSSSFVTGSASTSAIASKDTLMVDSLSTSVSGLVRDYVFAHVPLPSRVHSVIQAHKTDINAVKFTTDNRLIATGSNDGTVALFDVSTSRNCALLLTNTHGNSVLCLDTYGPMVTVGCSDRSVRIFDLHTQRVLRSLTGHNGKVQSVLYVPPSGGLTSGTDLSNLTSTASASSSTGFSRGMILSGGTDKTVKIWDYKDGRCVRSIDTRSIVNNFAISPDGFNIAVANQDGGIRLFDVRNGAKIAELSNAHSAGVTSITYSRADGGMTLLTAGRDNTLRLFDGRTLEALGPLVSKDGTSPVTKSNDANSPLLSSSLYVTGTRLRASSISPSNSFSNNNNTLNSSSSSSLQTPVVNPVIMKHSQFNLVTNWSRALLSPNGQYAIAGSSDSGIYVWSTAKGEFELELGSNKHQSSSSKLTKKPSAYAHPSGRSRGKSNEDYLFGGAFAELDNDTTTNQGYDTVPHHGAGVVSMDWSNDGQYLASGDTQGNLVLWTQ